MALDSEDSHFPGVDVPLWNILVGVALVIQLTLWGSWSLWWSDHLNIYYSNISNPGRMVNLQVFLQCLVWQVWVQALYWPQIHSLLWTPLLLFILSIYIEFYLFHMAARLSPIPKFSCLHVSNEFQQFYPSIQRGGYKAAYFCECMYHFLMINKVIFFNFILLFISVEWLPCSWRAMEFFLLVH